MGGVRVGGGVGGEDRLIEGLVGEAEPGGAFVVEVGEGALFEFGVLGGGGVDRGLADEAAGLLAADFGDIGEVVLGVDLGGDLLDPLGRVEPAFALVVEGFGDSGQRPMQRQAQAMSLNAGELVVDIFRQRICFITRRIGSPMNSKTLIPKRQCYCVICKAHAQIRKDLIRFGQQ